MQSGEFFYRDLADTESVADLLVQAAGDDERHDLPLPRAGMRVTDGRLRLEAAFRSCAPERHLLPRADVGVSRCERQVRLGT
jgi:hypothetical protein